MLEMKKVYPTDNVQASQPLLPDCLHLLQNCKNGEIIDANNTLCYVRMYVCMHVTI